MIMRCPGKFNVRMNTNYQRREVEERVNSELLYRGTLLFELSEQKLVARCHGEIEGSVSHCTNEQTYCLPNSHGLSRCESKLKGTLPNACCGLSTATVFSLIGAPIPCYPHKSVRQILVLSSRWWGKL